MGPLEKDVYFVEFAENLKATEVRSLSLWERVGGEGLRSIDRP
jgi:hypothetical protein